MCRLAYVPFSTEKEDVNLVGTLFQFLEVSFGGHGNGIGYFKENKPWLYKGAQLLTDTLADHMLDEGHSAIFHTRLASMGSICDANCHPFAYNGVLTAHNGHWSDAKEMAQMLIHADKFSKTNLLDMTDSEVIACLVGNYGFGSADIVNTGVILSLYKDHAKVYVKGDFEVIKTPEGRWLYASEFPRKIIEDWKVDYYMKFQRDSIAKLTDEGPILVRGNLTTTVPSAWPTYKHGSGRYSHGYESLYGYDVLDDYPRPPAKHTQQETLSFLPKRTGKKKNTPIWSWQIVNQVQEHIGFDPTPDLELLGDSIEHNEIQAALEELEVELDLILGSKVSDKNWRNQECNTAVLAWLWVNRTAISQYESTKKSVGTTYGFYPEDGDSYFDGFGNLWVVLYEEWRLFSELTEDEQAILEEMGVLEWGQME